MHGLHGRETFICKEACPLYSLCLLVQAQHLDVSSNMLHKQTCFMASGEGTSVHSAPLRGALRFSALSSAQQKDSGSAPLPGRPLEPDTRSEWAVTVQQHRPAEENSADRGDTYQHRGVCQAGSDSGGCVPTLSLVRRITQGSMGALMMRDSRTKPATHSTSSALIICAQHSALTEQQLGQIYLHSTAQHSTAQHSTAQHSTPPQQRSSSAKPICTQHSTAQHSTAQHSTTQQISSPPALP